MITWSKLFHIYEISNKGEIRNIKTNKILKTYLLNGYVHIKIPYEKGHEKTFSIHRLVAMTFILNPLNKPFVNHIDSDPLNNNVENLEWCTQRENIYHSRNISRNGAVISIKKIKRLYTANKTMSLEEFLNILYNNSK